MRLDTTDLSVVVRLSVFVERIFQPGDRKTDTPGGVNGFTAAASKVCLQFVYTNSQQCVHTLLPLS